MMLMDYVYQPEIAATLTEAINYITPVPAARTVISGRRQGHRRGQASLEPIATSPLVFPSEADYAKLGTTSR